MKSETIKAIFTNILFVVGIGLLIFGFINGALTTTRILTFDKYPLQNFEETRCDYVANPVEPAVPVKDIKEPDPNMKDLADQSQKCLTKLDHERKVRQTEDIVSSVSTLVAGSILVYSFRRFIFK